MKESDIVIRDAGDEQFFAGANAVGAAAALGAPFFGAPSTTSIVLVLAILVLNLVWIAHVRQKIRHAIDRDIERWKAAEQEKQRQ